LTTIAKYVPLVVWTVIVVFPLLVVVLTSFKTEQEYIRTSVFQLPQSFFNLSSFKTAFVQGNMLTAFKNSFLLIAVSGVFYIFLGAMTAYCLSRFSFRGKKMITGVYLVSAMIPSITLQVSIYGILKTMGLVGTMYAPLLLYIGTDLIQIWIYMQFLGKIDVSIDESAMIEGASYVRIFARIIFPMLAPATATILILKSVTIYNDLFVQNLYMMKTSLMTVTTALIVFQGNRVNDESLMCAAIVMIMLPTVVGFLALQKYIFNGITVGALKD
jgi:multiple sugar transport system permease protein